MTESLQARYIGSPHIHLKSVDSTNNYASSYIANNTPIEGTAITADVQTEGRGQYGRNWQGMAEKNIYLSIILKPHFLEVSDQYLLNKAIAVALCESIETTTNLSVKIKWPNDLYIDHKKVGGVLIQNTLLGRKLASTIVGIGINVNQSQFYNLPNPTSLILECNRAWDIPYMYRSIFYHIECWYEKLKNKEITVIETIYNHKLFRLGEKIMYRKDNQAYEGIQKGVDRLGRLILEDRMQQSFFRHGEIEIELNQ